MEKINIGMTKDEIIKYFENKIVKDAINDCMEFSNVVNVADYGENAIKYKKEILEKMYNDERVADVYLDEDGYFDMVFYTDYCPHYFEEEIE